MRQKFLQHKNRYKVVLHSKNYVDATFCKDHGIPFSVIPNGIDLDELQQSKLNFRANYNINTKYMFLCVANFFEGKGHEHLINLVKDLNQQRQDFTVVIISSTIAYTPGNVKREQLKQECDRLGLPVLFLTDIPREHVTSAYHDCDFFVFCSEQEVSPLVILESMSCKKPWIGMNVGNLLDLHGGICHEGSRNSSDKIIFDSDMHQKFLTSIKYLCDNNNSCIYLGKSGYQQIINEYNWVKIKEQYHKLFTE
jgi:glycosyltransferase involved in cell wall biosynthesis